MSIDENVLHAVGMGIKELRRDNADKEQSLGNAASQIDFLKSQLAVTKSSLDAAQAELRVHKDAEPNRRRNLAQLDRITLELFNYIEELERQARKAKTVAAKQVLNEAVLRLRVIRDPELAS